MVTVNSHALNINECLIYSKLIKLDVPWTVSECTTLNSYSQSKNYNNAVLVFYISLSAVVILFVMQLRKSCIPKCYRKICSLLEINFHDHSEL